MDQNHDNLTISPFEFHLFILIVLIVPRHNVGSNSSFSFCCCSWYSLLLNDRSDLSQNRDEGEETEKATLFWRRSQRRWDWNCDGGVLILAPTSIKPFGETRGDVLEKNAWTWPGKVSQHHNIAVGVLRLSRTLGTPVSTKVGCVLGIFIEQEVKPSMTPRSWGPDS